MTKRLVLKPRALGPNGVASWHDKTLLMNAISTISKGMSLTKLGAWISVAGKIEAAADDEEFGTQVNGKLHLPEFELDIKNQEARLLWRELEKLPFENFGGGDIVPNIGLLYNMLSDIAESLDEKMPEVEEDGDSD